MSDEALRFIMTVNGARRDEDIDERTQRDVLMIEDALRNRGYLDAHVDPPRVAKPSNGCALQPTFEVRYSIHEESPYRVGKLTMVERDEHGHPLAPIGGKPLRERLSQRDGELFGRGGLVFELQEIRTLYGDAGYGDAEIDPETRVDVASKKVDLDIHIRRGPLITIDRVDVVGNPSVPRSTILQLAGITAGERWSTTKIEEATQRLRGLAALASADASVEHVPSATRWTVTFEVKEKAP